MYRIATSMIWLRLMPLLFCGFFCVCLCACACFAIITGSRAAAISESNRQNGILRRMPFVSDLLNSKARSYDKVKDAKTTECSICLD